MYLFRIGDHVIQVVPETTQDPTRTGITYHYCGEGRPLDIVTNYEGNWLRRRSLRA
jgi:hypothetical protein